MTTALAFFPWLESREAVRVGSVRLIPYVFKKAPGDQPTISQADIDGMLRAYSRKQPGRDRGATLVEVGGWRMGTAASPRIVARLFHVRELVAFSALARRGLFSHLDYTNYHAYTLVVQRYQAGHTGTFAFTTRRRDGGTSQMWGSEEFAFHIPNHVRGNASLRIDEPLLRALLRMPPNLSHITEAIREFNAANTDSSEVPLHVEMVMMKSAFEWLLGVNEQASAFQSGLMALLGDLPQVTVPTGPCASRWVKKWNKTRPIAAWARDFCVVRSAAAHGKKRNARRASVWAAHSHLAFASLLFPLLVKKVLRDAGLLKMDYVDAEKLKRIDAYLMHDPFAPRPRGARHPWSKADTDALIEARAPFFYKAVSKAFDKPQS